MSIAMRYSARKMNENQSTNQYSGIAWISTRFTVGHLWFYELNPYTNATITSNMIAVRTEFLDNFDGSKFGMEDENLSL